jgi:hypothetical protein
MAVFTWNASGFMIARNFASMTGKCAVRSRPKARTVQNTMTVSAYSFGSE